MSETSTTHAVDTLEPASARDPEVVPPKRQGRPQRALRVGLVALLVLLSVGGIATWVVARSAAGVIQERVAAAGARFGKRIGRTVTVGPARVVFAKRIAIQIDGVAIAPVAGQSGPGAALPLVEIGAIRVGVALWPLLRSLGKELDLRYVELVHPVLNVVRLADGRMSYADVATRLAVPDPSGPDELFGPDAWGHAVIARASIDSGALRYYEASAVPARGTGPAAALEAIDVVAVDVKAGAPLAITIDAAAVGLGKNLHVELSLAASASVDGGLAGAIARIRRGVVRLRPVQVESIASFLPSSGGHGVARGVVEAELTFAIPEGAVSVEVAGTLGAVALVRTRPGGVTKGARAAMVGAPPDAAIDVKARVDAAFNLATMTLDVRALDVRAGSRQASGKGELKFRSPLGADGIDVDLRAVHLVAFGGTVDASGSSFAVGRTPAPFALRAKVENLDAAEVIAVFGATEDASGGGRINGTVSLDGMQPNADATWPSVAPGMTGKLSFELHDAQIKPKRAITATILDPLLAELARFAAGVQPAASIDMTVTRATGRFDVGGGKLTITEPLRVASAGGALAVSGTIGMDQALSLNGSFDVPPAVISKATSGMLTLADSVRIGLRIGGTLETPRVVVTGVQTSLAALARSGIRGLVDKIEGVLGQ